MDADNGEDTGRLGRLGSNYLNATHPSQCPLTFREPDWIAWAARVHFRRRRLNS